ncbi:hypothetical protein JV173_01900 [Acholeplasma equirhinis]|uniref:ribonuclease III domain-containing protein n=1 Tax=Acholeplasma equirhinis TaxID=555393 RepID=UPI00197AC309|nr:ribonuclease III domain-containing protein [Acholeplasma equirhinis]MBN3490258.1 hypothetical protein [Acholeplasma equirhinis]
MIDDKVKNLIEKFSFESDNKYFTEVLYVAKYASKPQAGMSSNMQLKEIENPNRALALIGDRVLKLVLAQEGRKMFDNVEKINDFINSNESNEHLDSLGIIQSSNGYCTENDKVVENKKSDVISIATMIEAIIGSLYLDEYQKYGTFNNVYQFIIKYIITGTRKQGLND